MSDKQDNSQLWMVPYADLMSCLVILFLALYGFAYNAKRPDYEAALAKMQEELGIKVKKQKKEEIEAAKKVEKELEEKIKEGSLGMEVSTSRIRLTFASPVLFDSGSAALKPSAAKLLDPVVDSLLKMDNRVVVEGHTDSARMLGRKFASNRELSLNRAFSVIDYLVRRGVPPSRLTAFGYGEFRPVGPNETPEQRAKNRRIEMIIMRQMQEEESSS